MMYGRIFQRLSMLDLFGKPLLFLAFLCILAWRPVDALLPTFPQFPFPVIKPCTKPTVMDHQYWNALPSASELRGPWTFDKFKLFPGETEERELCDIGVTQEAYSRKYCDFFGNGGYDTQSPGPFTCAADNKTCSKYYWLIKDGLVCWHNVGPDEDGDDPATYRISGFYQAVTQTKLNIIVAGQGTVVADGTSSTQNFSKNVVQRKPFSLSATETPGTGYKFMRWEVVSGKITSNGIPNSAPSAATGEIFLPSGEATIRAVFELKQYTLTVRPVTVGGVTNGTTTPSGNVTVLYNVATAITATGNAGFRFSEWSGTQTLPTGTQPLAAANRYHSSTTVTLTAGNGVMEAGFVQEQYSKLIVVNDGNGTTTPVNPVLKPLCCTYLVDISATPVAGYEFDHWEVVGTAVGQSGTFDDFHSATTRVTLDAMTAPSTLTVKAFFRPATFKLTVENDGNGTTSPSTADVPRTILFPIQATNTIQGYRFKEWILVSGGATISNVNSASTTVVLTSHATVRANFERVYPITLTAEGSGTFSQTSPFFVAVDEIASLQALPDPGWEFQEWKIVLGSLLFVTATGPSISLKLFQPGDAEIKAVFRASTAQVGGLVKNAFDNLAIGGAQVKLRRSDGKEYSTTTHTDGTYNLGSVLTGSYTLTITHSCFGTVIQGKVLAADQSYTFNNALSRQVSMYTTYSKLLKDQVTTLSIGACGDATQESWTTDKGGAEQKTLDGDKVDVSFANIGFKNTEVKVVFANGEIITVGDPLFIEVVECTDAPPVLHLNADKLISNGEAIDYCYDGFGTERLDFSADLLAGICPNSDLTTYQWTRNGTSVGTDQSVSLDITTTPSPQTVKVVATRSGKSASKEIRISLRDCPLDNSGRPILIRKEIVLKKKTTTGTVTVLENVPGENVRDDDGDVTLKGQAIIIPGCGECKHETTFKEWILSWKDDDGHAQSRSYTTQNDDLRLDQGFRAYSLTAVADIKDIQPGHLHTFPQIKITRAIKVLPKVPLPKMGTCDTPPFFCQEFYSDALPDSRLDLHKSVLDLPSEGGGFSGDADDGKYSFVPGMADFVFSARIKTLHGQAGIMMRASLLLSDRMLFLSRDADHIAATHRERFAQDAIPYDFAASGSDCLRMTRVGNKISLFAQSSTGSVCPEPENDALWGTPLESGLAFDLSHWTGHVHIGLAASGSPGDVTSFDNVYVRSGEKLTDPALTLNTVFADGNMIRNWSFENQDDAFSNGDVFAWNKEETSGNTAYSGRHFARISGKANGVETRTLDRLPLHVTNNGQPATGFSLKFKVRQSEDLNVRPSIILTAWDGAQKTILLPVVATVNYSDWFEYAYVLNFKEITDVGLYETLQLHLIAKDGIVGATQYLDVDDVLMSPNFQNQEIRNKPVNVMTFADGFTRAFQTVSLGQTEDIVLARLLSADGELERTLPVFGGKAALSPGEFHKLRLDPQTSAEAYFNDATSDLRQRTSESPIDFKPKWSDFREETGRVIMDPSPTSRPVQTYGRNRAKSEDVTVSYQANDARTQVTTTSTFGGTEKSRISKIVTNALGQAVELQSLGGPTDNTPLVTTRENDVLGRVWKITTPSRTFDKNFTFNTLNQQTSEEDKDIGEVKRIYDKRGQIRFVLDSKKSAKGEFLANKYDNLGRITGVYLVSGLTEFTQELADNPFFPDGEENVTLLIQSVYDRVPANVPSEVSPLEMTHLKGRAAASFAFSNIGTVASYFGYDERGRVKTVWKAILNLPIQRTDFTYNLGGQVVKKVSSGKRPNTMHYSKSEDFGYDEFNRLKTIQNGEPSAETREIAKFEYWPDGKTRYLDFGKGYKQGTSYSYDESERLTHIRHESLQTTSTGARLFYPSDMFEQSLNWSALGNIESQNYHLGGVTNPYRGAKYAYDNHDRLVDVDYGESHASYSDIDYSASSKYNSNYMYDEDGMLTGAVRGKANVANASDYGLYVPYEGTHRVNSITGELAAGGPNRAADENFIYDKNGNMILDKGGKKAFEYDFRNLPVRISLCATVAADRCEKTESMFLMVYDAGGNRVVKLKKD